MSPPAGYELDFGFGSLLDGGVSTNNPLASSNLSEFGTSNGNGASGNGASAADFLSLSNLFDSSTGNMNVNVNNMNSAGGNSNTGAPSSSSWHAQTKKTLLDQQQQQLQQDQNSLNALLSQHASSNGGVGNAAVSGTTVSSTSSTPNPFGFATREELESLAASTSNINVNQQHQQQQASFQQNTNLNAGGSNNGNNNYMFVATIVDPNQEDAPPQQMLFLPGSNQVIPMPSSATGATTSTGLSSMMALANLPVVFPQGNNNSAENNTSSATTNWSSLQSQQLQQLNGFSAGMNQLEEAFHSAQAQAQAQQALAPAPVDFSSQGPHHHQLPSLKPALAPSTSSTSANNDANANNNKAAMPVRPLSAYNFFFSDERERILQNKTDETDVFDNNKKQRLLLAHLAKDRSKRRPHRKTHGKINFTTLSKLIGSRWKQLPDERKNFYREVAAIDLERYQRELRERSPPNNASGGANNFCA